jgi:carboxypeptidase Taq
MAAQLYDAAENDIDGLEEQLRAGEFDALHEWLTANVHSHGRRYRTNELVREATGADFSADAFVAYVNEKFGELYGL